MIHIPFVPEFEKVAELFCKPSREELEGKVRLNNPQDNPFYLVFPQFWTQLGHGGDVSIPTSASFLCAILSRMTMVTEAADQM